MTRIDLPATLVAKPGAVPTQIAVSDDLSFLEVTTAAGDVERLGAERLRLACKCAHCLRARIDGAFPNRFEGIAITAVAPVGGYAINLSFSDGHARGIYPWAFLLGLVEGAPDAQQH
ncbi:gamma-butyrobetaine hydroxylase-like domain-containing protein [Rhodopseudomonas sp. P2A-2r]|nr:gamma-butyrobetaine hydroxylase-like domain-containing protein [Rhodopseudomonas sp. P2A-2r]UZE52009.1 gamma-butyrobetaine hydroxylase-like domain-containing protein [Rhodopseudomonas sp. P2A-2r]